MAKKRALHGMQAWMPQDPALKPYYSGIVKFVEKNLPKGSERPESGKIIHIPLNGDIHFAPHEIAIIDTPLFQRLRVIKQVGLAHLVFPSLTHSRFEHSLGVVGRLDQLLGHVLKNTEQPNPRQLREKLEKYLIPLRLAALMHDLGHCLFSHCSERVINNLKGTSGKYPSSPEIRKLFTNHFGKKSQIPFAELFAVSIIGTQRFHDFFKELDFPRQSEKDIPLYLSQAARFILGLPMLEDPETVFLSQLLSGGLDADKVDYMTREAHYAGINLGIDLDRILSKIQVFELDSHLLPRNLHHLKSSYGKGKKYWVLGFAKGGQYAFEEFCISRLSLHVKIYLHQKVRSAEAQLSQYLKQLSESGIFTEAHHWLSLQESIIESTPREPDLFGGGVSVAVTQIPFSNIKQRDLYKRAFAFGHMNSLTESTSVSVKDSIDYAEEASSIKLFNRLKENPEVVVEAIYTEYRHIAELLRIPSDERHLQRGDVLLDIPRESNIQQGHESLYFSRPALIPLRWTIPINRIVLYYQLNRSLAYVFCPAHSAPLVHLASEAVIFDMSRSVYLPEGSVSSSTLRDVNELRKELDAKGYYESRPDLKPKSDYLNSAEAAEKIHLVVDRLAKFTSQKGEKASIDRVTTYVNQFPTELHASVLDFLRQLRVVETEQLEKLLVAEVQRQLTFGGRVAVCAIGGLADSAMRMMYDFRDSIREAGGHLCILNDKTIMDHDAIILYDDNINSCMQLFRIMDEMHEEQSNLPPEMRLKEDHDTTVLSEQGRGRLKSIPVSFVFTLASEGAPERLESGLVQYFSFKPELVRMVTGEVMLKSKRLFHGDDSPFQHEEKNALRDAFREIGQELLINKGKPAAIATERALGYASAEAMIVFPYNVPTMTVTALWLASKYRGKNWIPLVERRGRQDNGAILGEDE